jgi:hypothetical protein
LGKVVRKLRYKSLYTYNACVLSLTWVWCIYYYSWCNISKPHNRLTIDIELMNCFLLQKELWSMPAMCKFCSIMANVGVEY